MVATKCPFDCELQGLHLTQENRGDCRCPRYAGTTIIEKMKSISLLLRLYLNLQWSLSVLALRLVQIRWCCANSGFRVQ